MHSQSAPSQSIASATLPVCVVSGTLRQWLSFAPNGTSSFPYAAREAGASLPGVAIVWGWQYVRRPSQLAAVEEETTNTGNVRAD